MLEIMMGGKPSVGYYPNSGPGNKTILHGDSTMGYFGVVTAAELFEGSAMVNFSKLVGVGYRLTGLEWLKFIYNNKVLFFAKHPIQSGISWSELYNESLVYGVRGYGNYPIGEGRDQIRMMSKVDIANGRTWHLKVRLPQGFTPDPFTQSANSNTLTAETAGTEWDNLMLKVASVAAGGTGEWASFSLAELGMTGAGAAASLVKETQSSNVNNNGARGDSVTPKTSVIVSKTDITCYWRPVLELTDANGVALEIREVFGSSSVNGLKRFSPIPAIVEPTLNVNSLKWSVSQLKPFDGRGYYYSGLPIQYIGSTFVSQGSAGSATGKSLPLPAGTQPGDFAVLILHSYNDLYAPTPTGWLRARNASGAEVTGRLYKFIDSLANIDLPAHNSRYIARVMVFRGATAGTTLLVQSTIGTGATAAGTITVPAGTTVHPSGFHYLISTFASNASTDLWGTSDPYPFAEAQTQHVTPATSAYCGLSTCGMPWEGGGVTPAHAWTFHDAAGSAGQTLLIRAPD